MRYAILGDIHSNWEALSTVVAEAKKLKVDRFISVGDIVGYGPDPEPCMDLLAQISCEAVAGNHDQAVGGLTDFSAFSDGAKAGILWTQEKIHQPYLEKLRVLPLILQTEDFSAVHASLENPSQWAYVLNNQHAISTIRLQQRDICFYGHTHLPVIFREDGNTTVFHEGPVSLTRGHRYLINAGSVGQPRDGDPHACLLIFDSTTFSLHMHSFAYDVLKTQQKILQEGLPAALALRLSYGR